VLQEDESLLLAVSLLVVSLLAVSLLVVSLLVVLLPVVLLPVVLVLPDRPVPYRSLSVMLAFRRLK
jgi:hypothetical protein